MRGDSVETYEMGLQRATIELELVDGARISLEIRGGDALVRLMQDRHDIVLYGQQQPIRTIDANKTLHVEVDGAMGSFKMTGLTGLRAPR